MDSTTTVISRTPLNNVLMDGDNFDDVVSTAIHDAYQNGNINGDYPPIVGTSSIALGKRKRRRIIDVEEAEEESEAAKSSTAITAIISSISGTNTNANASGSNSTTIIPTPVLISKWVCTKCGCDGRNSIGNPDPPARPFRIKKAILDACIGRCNRMEQADYYPIGTITQLACNCVFGMMPPNSRNKIIYSGIEFCRCVVVIAGALYILLLIA
jgi:hypothetical protein